MINVLTKKDIELSTENGGPKVGPPRTIPSDSPSSGVRDFSLLRFGDVNETGLEHIHPFLKLFLGNYQRNEDTHYITQGACGDGNESVLVSVVRKFLRFSSSRFAGLTITNEFKSAHSAQDANVTDQRPLFLPTLHPFLEPLAECRGAGEKAVLFDSLNGGESRFARSKGLPPNVPPRAYRAKCAIHDVRFAGHRCYRKPAAEGLPFRAE